MPEKIPDYARRRAEINLACSMGMAQNMAAEDRG